MPTLKHVLPCAIALVAVIPTLSAQQGPLLPVIGKVTDGEAKLPDCTIIAFKDNVAMDTLVTGKNGKFDLALELQHTYGIEFRAEGYVPKRILVETAFPHEEEDIFFEPLVMDISLLLKEKYEGVDADVLDFPFAIVRFDKGQQAFVQDRDYTMGMQRANGALLLMAARARKE
ncbi:MAG: hypothetical protein KDB88_01250 [Flavobacteriales bacterium]|nr:hypothetical protein [Flavobacteriales bacterium]